MKTREFSNKSVSNLWTRRIAITAMFTLTLSMSLILASSAFTYGYISTSKGNPTIVVSKRNSSPTMFSSTRIHGTFLPTSPDVFFVLVIGNDYRPGVEGKRADAIHLLGINPVEEKVTILNFPRDTNVAIPGYGKNKINAANAYGGSELTAKTLEQLTGVSIKYVLEADFAAFTDLVDDLGGIDVTVEKSMMDKNSGTNFSPGVISMSGSKALAFTRDRYSFADGDLSRSQNQGKVLIAALAEMKKSKTSLSSRFESAALIAKHLKLTNLSLRDVFFLMQQAEKINPESITNLLVPWSGSNTLAPKATQLFADFKDNAILDTYK